MLVPSCPAMRRAGPTLPPLLPLLVLALLGHLADAQSKWTVPTHKHREKLSPNCWSHDPPGSKSGVSTLALRGPERRGCFRF